MRFGAMLDVTVNGGYGSPPIRCSARPPPAHPQHGQRSARCGCLPHWSATGWARHCGGRCRQLRGSAQCSLASPQRCPGPAGCLAPAGRPALLQLPRRGGCAPAHVRGGRLHTGGGSDCGPRSRFLRSGRGWKNSSGLPRGRERIQRGGVSINAPMSCNSCCRCEEGHCT